MIPTFETVPAAQRSGPTLVRRVDHLFGPAGHLEAILNEGSPDAGYAAVICHPHPKGGGNLNNKVVYRAMKALNGPEFGLGWPVLRFNFRGMGSSQGTYDGFAEAGDVVAALRSQRRHSNAGRRLRSPAAGERRSFPQSTPARQENLPENRRPRPRCMWWTQFRPVGA